MKRFCDTVPMIFNQDMVTYFNERLRDELINVDDEKLQVVLADPPHVEKERHDLNLKLEALNKSKLVLQRLC
jgi:hypothetical protein